ncbi:MAG: alpha/beta hydrolase [Cyanothece sp. SIO2G6]|nr:alpha/beta hydrolase [Cyanothece sp. SIO2G6]
MVIVRRLLATTGRSLLPLWLLTFTLCLFCILGVAQPVLAQERLAPNPFTKGGQSAWFHDQGDASGFFHTYDALAVGDQPHKVHVFVPRDYETSQARYPVIYVNDGDTTFFRGGAINESWFLASVLGDLYQSGQMQQVIVVAIYPRDRSYEYTHTNIGDTPGGGIEQYANYVANGVKRFIDDNYRTQADADHTLILGASHGGLAAYLMGMLQPTAFGNVAAFSPSFWVGLDSDPISLIFSRSMESSELIQLSEPTLNQPSRHPQIYMDWGLIRDGQFHNDFIEARTTVRGRELRDLLTRQYNYRLNQDLFVLEDGQGEHSELSWRRRVPAVLKLFFGTI